MKFGGKKTTGTDLVVFGLFRWDTDGETQSGRKSTKCCLDEQQTDSRTFREYVCCREKEMKQGKDKQKERLKKERLKKVFTAVILLTIAFIWGHSMMPGDLSGEESGFVYRILSPVMKLFLPDAWVTEHLVRKMAHFSEHGALGVELTLYAALYRDLQIRRIANILYSGLTAAFIDETIQIFSGRGAAIADVWIDLFGFATGLLIVRLICICRQCHKCHQR